jgi:hypothetical protein
MVNRVHAPHRELTHGGATPPGIGKGGGVIRLSMAAARQNAAMARVVNHLLTGNR